MQLLRCLVFGALGGAATVMVVRTVAPAQHREIMDVILMVSAAAAVYQIQSVDEAKTRDNFANVAGLTLATAYVTGGTPLTSMLLPL